MLVIQLHFVALAAQQRNLGFHDRVFAAFVLVCVMCDEYFHS
jgi:hypothetical protein